jgi:LPXTG-motif cell wall-anchored protein
MRRTPDPEPLGIAAGRGAGGVIERLPVAIGGERPPASGRGDVAPTGPSARLAEAAARVPIAAELLSFAALAALLAWSWLSLVSNPPVGRGIAAVAVALIGAICLAAIPRARAGTRGVRAAMVSIVAATMLGGVIAVGLPLHYLVPAGWDDLASGLGTGVPGALSAAFPYIGTDEWTRLVLLCGLPVVLGVSVALAFGPGASRRSRAWGLVAPVAGFAVATALRAPAEPLVWGVALFAAMAAWLWLGRTARGAAMPAMALVLAAAAVALPVASKLNRGGPLLDYQNWNIDLSGAAGSSISYSWDQTYGPLQWSRTGRTLMTVTGTSAAYWRTSVLDHFDGLRWMATSGTDNVAYELPAVAERASTLPDQLAALDPRWIHRATVNIDALSSDLVVAPGAVLKLPNLPLESSGPSGLRLPPDETLGDGSSYKVVAYEPDPDASVLRAAAPHLDPGLRQFTELQLPRVAPGKVPAVPTDALGHPLQRGVHPGPSVSLSTIEMPLYGTAPGRHDRRLLARSAYGSVYALARRLTAHTATEFGAVRAIEHHLRTDYSYSESPPRRTLPLRAFLFRDRRGYCQQFSGAMALMLRTIGIPARVAAGFSPGVTNPHGSGWVIRDLDAHSWVEVYFNGIGWVPFDPTPAASPAHSQAPGGGSLPAQGPSRQLAGQAGGRAQAITGPAPATGGGTSWWLVVFVLAAAVVAAGGLVALRRRRRFLALAPAEAMAALANELGDLVRRLQLDQASGLTLLELERRLQTVAGPEAGAYPRALRLARYGAGSEARPSLRDRRALRRAIFGHGGSYRYAAGLAALPPGGPR